MEMVALANAVFLLTTWGLCGDVDLRLLQINSGNSSDAQKATSILSPAEPLAYLNSAI